MIDLYKYISEGLLRGMDNTIDAGEREAESILIEDWIKDSKEFVSLWIKNVNDISKCISSDNKIDARSFNPWYAYADKELELPAPDYIKFGKVESMSMTMNKNVNFADLPHIDKCGELLLKPFADGLKLDLYELPIDEVRVFEWVYDSSNIVRYPKNTDIDIFVMWQSREPYTSYGSQRFMIGFDKLKGLKCNTLAIPDIMFAEKYSDFNTGTNSLIKNGSFDFDSQPGQMILKLYEDKSIQFKNLFVYSVCTPDQKFYKIKKDKNGFNIAKRATTLI